jgi:hypothetical protein
VKLPRYFAATKARPVLREEMCDLDVQEHIHVQLSLRQSLTRRPFNSSEKSERKKSAALTWRPNIDRHAPITSYWSARCFLIHLSSCLSHCRSMHIQLHVSKIPKKESIYAKQCTKNETKEKKKTRCPTRFIVRVRAHWHPMA